MTTLGDIFRRYGPQYRARYGHHMSADQHVAMHAIEQCRTEALGGHVYACPSCQVMRYSYDSCRNRHCPTCQHDATQAWLAEQHMLLLPVPYFLVTFTLPSELRALARQQPETIYRLLFRTSAAALQQLAQNPRFLGGEIGMLGVLQTWTRDLRYPPTSTIWCQRLPWRQMARAGWSGSTTFWCMSNRLVNCFERSSARGCARRRGWVRSTRALGPSRGLSTAGRLGAGRAL